MLGGSSCHACDAFTDTFWYGLHLFAGTLATKARNVGEGVICSEGRYPVGLDPGTERNWYVETVTLPAPCKVPPPHLPQSPPSLWGGGVHLHITHEPIEVVHNVYCPRSFSDFCVPFDVALPP